MTISELEEYFKTAALPEELVLHRSTRINDTRKCVDSFIDVAKQYQGSPIGDIFIDHLMQIKATLER